MTVNVAWPVPLRPAGEAGHRAAEYAEVRSTGGEQAHQVGVAPDEEDAADGGSGEGGRPAGVSGEALGFLEGEGDQVTELGGLVRVFL